MARVASFALMALAIPSLVGAQAGEMAAQMGHSKMGAAMLFTVRIENVSTPQTLTLSSGGTAPAPTAPVLWVLHTAANPVFTEGQLDRGLGLEALAEDGARPGQRLSLAFMFGQSNDLFYAARGPGIDLFPNGQPLSGDLTAQLVLWDAGTEVNEEPGVGSNQAPRQPAPNTGPSERLPVAPVHDAFTYPPTAQVIRVTITPAGDVRMM